jgi:hypothetical protein
MKNLINKWYCYSLTKHIGSDTITTYMFSLGGELFNESKYNYSGI